MKIGDICNRDVVTVSRDSSILEAVKLMRARHVGDVVVTELNDDRNPVGILTDRDVVIEILAEELELDAVSVGDAMSHSLITAPRDADLFETIRFMGTKGVRRIPVLDGEGKLYGLLSIDEVVKLLATEIQFVSEVFSSQIERERSLRS